MMCMHTPNSRSLYLRLEHFISGWDYFWFENKVEIACSAVGRSAD